MGESGSGPTAGGSRPNLWAQDLRCYGFGVRTAMGSTPMRYLVGRRFGGEPAATAVTVLFVIEPSVLLGTYVHIAEDVTRATCVVHTYLPTMARPLRVADTVMFDCLPLTDVGYVDLMAWRPPSLRAVPSAEAAAAADAGPDLAAGWPAARSFRFDGDLDLPPLWMHERADPDLGVVVRRTFWRAGVEVRRWETTELGEPGREGLPRRIRVTRPRTGHQTEFDRFTPATAVPPELFDAPPLTLRDWLADAAEDAVAGAGQLPA
jgi:hypothetical protein